MCDCCICYESIPKWYPRTKCCNQLIHTQCIQKVYGPRKIHHHYPEMVDIRCPWCRSLMVKYRRTRSSLRVQDKIQANLKRQLKAKSKAEVFILQWKMYMYMKKNVNTNGYTRFTFPSRLDLRLNHLQSKCFKRGSWYLIDQLNEKQKDFIRAHPLWDIHDPIPGNTFKQGPVLEEDGISYD